MRLIKIGGYEVDIDTPVNAGHGEKTLLHRVIAILQHQEKQIEHINRKVKEIMVTQEALNASATRLEAAAKTIIGLLGTGGAVTPDTVVVDFQTKVDAQSAALEAASAGTGTTGT